MDLISRTEAIEDVKSWEAVDGREKHLQKNVVEWLKELPSAQPKGEWIPFNERLPEDGETVLVQFDDGEMDILTFPNIYKRLNRVAWMPLPDPYQGEGEQE